MTFGTATITLPATPAAASFDRENRALVLARARIGAWIGALVILAFVPIDAIRLPHAFFEATTIRVVGAALLFAAIPLSKTAGAERFAFPIAAWVVAVLGVIDAAIMRYSLGAADPAYVLQVVGMIFLVLGASLLLPMDGKRMFAIVLVPLVLHAVVSSRFPIEENLPYVFATFVAVIIAAIGAHASYLTRLTEYERRAAKEELLRSQEEFVAMISHDIRNPIGVIQGYAAIVRESEGLDDEARECLQRLEAAAGTALLLANNVLDLARLGTERPSRREPCDLPELLSHALDGQRLFFDAKDVRLEVTVDGEIPPVLLDRAQMERVFANLLTNALKYTPQNGEVRVAAKRAGEGGVEIRIEDSGEGIPPGTEEEIFRRFARVSRQHDSTGLGLFIARSIVSAHGGRVFAENRTESPGARFVVELPSGTPRAPLTP